MVNASFSNSSAYCGGAINNIGTLVFDSCTIRNCNAAYGGGIFNSYNTTGNQTHLTIKNSTITDNSTTGAKYPDYPSGGGLMSVYGDQGVNTTLEGIVVISSNTTSTNDDDNVCLGDATYLNVKDLSSGSTIGISAEKVKTEPTISNDTSDISYFISDNKSYEVKVVDGKLALQKKTFLISHFSQIFNKKAVR